MLFCDKSNCVWNWKYPPTLRHNLIDHHLPDGGLTSRKNLGNIICLSNWTEVKINKYIWSRSDTSDGFCFYCHISLFDDFNHIQNAKQYHVNVLTYISKNFITEKNICIYVIFITDSFRVYIELKQISNFKILITTYNNATLFFTHKNL